MSNVCHSTKLMVKSNYRKIIPWTDIENCHCISLNYGALKNSILGQLMVIWCDIIDVIWSLSRAKVNMPHMLSELETLRQISWHLSIMWSRLSTTAYNIRHDGVSHGYFWVKWFSSDCLKQDTYLLWVCVDAFTLTF